MMTAQLSMGIVMNVKPFLSSLTNLLYSFGMLVSALFITWCLLSRVDFLYPTFYQWLDINETVAEFGPQNRYKEGFGETSSSQHFDYFSQIVTAINNDGKGLSAIHYPFKGRHVQLLRDAEIHHLEDVAHLLNGLFNLAIGTATFMVLLLGYRVHRQRELPSVKKQVVQLLILVGTLTMISAIFGFKEVFYWLHRVSFPASNEWFFYYQDSLMTTMMKAPTLFGPISVLLVLMTCLVFIALNFMVTAGYKRVVQFTHRNG
jgi:uncharacterized membrane protein